MLLPMSPADSLFLIGETREQPMHVGGLQLFDPPEGADAVDILGLFRDLLGDTDVVPRMAKRARRSVTTGGLWGWETDHSIDLEHHVRHGALPQPGRVLELLALVSRLHGTLLDRSRPLWELQLIEGLSDGRMAMYTKIHHSVMDGIACMRTIQRSLSPDPSVAFVPPWAPSPGERPQRSSRVPSRQSAIDQLTGTADAAAHLAVNAAGIGPALAKTVLRGLRAQAAPLSFTAPRSMLNVSISGSRRFAAQDWPIDRIKQVAKASDVTLNDVVLAMCSGALRTYLLDFDALPDSPLIAMVPVSLRESGGDREGNAIGMVMCNLGTTLPDPAARLREVHDSMVEGKQLLSELTPLQILAMSALGLGPVAVNLVLPLQDIARPPFNVTISNVPGPQEPLYLNGARMSGLYPLSIPFQGQALNITCTSYSDVIGFGLTGDRKALPHLQRMLGYLDDELAALELAAGLA